CNSPPTRFSNSESRLSQGEPSTKEAAQGSLSALRRRPVFFGQDRSASLSSRALALALIRQRPMLGSQPRKGGSRFDVADRFRDTRENLGLSAVIGRTVHLNPSANLPGRVRP